MCFPATANLTHSKPDPPSSAVGTASGRQNLACPEAKDEGFRGCRRRAAKFRFAGIVRPARQKAGARPGRKIPLGGAEPLSAPRSGACSRRRTASLWEHGALSALLPQHPVPGTAGCRRCGPVLAQELMKPQRWVDPGSLLAEGPKSLGWDHEGN
jgi:hypothetical protein